MVRLKTFKSINILGVKSMIITINSSQSINETVKKMNPKDILVLENGIYHEKVEIWTDYITIKAKNPHHVIITNKDYYHKIMPNHNECNTFGTYSLLIGADHVVLEGILIQNKATPSSIYGQAVALHVIGNHFYCSNCIIMSEQDTLFTGPLPKDLIERYRGFYEEKKLKENHSIQHYKNCWIYGNVDFIFGCATVLFEQCDLFTIGQLEHKVSYICAPAHEKNIPYGYLFYKCNLTGSGPTYLARPWRDYGCAAFIDCTMDSNILPEGFNKWNNTNRDQTARFYEYTPTQNTNNRVTWSHQLTKKEADQYVNNFIAYMQS